MEKLLIFTIVGLSLAAIYSIISSGLVLTYTTTGIFNFAHGAAGMLAAFTYWQLRFDWGWPAPVALFVVLVVLAPALGLLLERVIMRGLVGTTEATKLVVSISLLVGMIGLANVIWKPGVSRPMSTFFQGQTIDLGVTTITYHQAITIAVAILVAVGLRLLLFRTRMGVSMRANVDGRWRCSTAPGPTALRSTAGPSARRSPRSAASSSPRASRWMRRRFHWSS